MPATIRSFIAIDLPKTVVCRLEDAQRQLKALNLPAKWVRPENIHLTLKFLGNISSDRVDVIARVISLAAEGRPPLTLELRGIGFFPGVKRARVVWIGLGGQVQPLFALQREVEQQLAAIGIAPEKKPFRGHLTLGRIRQHVAPPVMRKVLDTFADFSSDGFAVDRVCLYQSELRPTGPVYTRLKEIALHSATHSFR